MNGYKKFALTMPLCPNASSTTPLLKVFHSCLSISVVANVGMKFDLYDQDVDHKHSTPPFVQKVARTPARMM
jgi:hypothetical protein